MPPINNANLTGPTTVAAGGTSTNFTISPIVPITGTYTPNDGGYGGTFTPSSLSWTSSSTPKTFVYNAPNIPGIATITPVWNAPNVQTSPASLNITVTGTNAAQHTYQFPQVAGVPPFQILFMRDQVPGATPTPATYTQAIVPSSGFVPATATLTYTLSKVLGGDIIITPVATNGTFSPTSVTITAGSLTGTTTLSDAVVGVSTISSTNNQSLADPANITFTGLNPVASTSYGTMEAGGGTISALGAGAAAILMGPIQTPVRESLKETVSVAADGAFNLDYMYTIDAGSTWIIGKQVASSTTAADGTTYTNRARLKIETGFQWKIQVYNPGGSAINVAYEKRFISRGRGGS